MTKNKSPHTVLKSILFLFGILAGSSLDGILAIDGADGGTETIAATSSTRTIVLVKIGGSSVTHKHQYETLNADSLDWFSRTIASAISDYFRPPKSGDDDECSLNDSDGEYDEEVVDSCSNTSSSSSKNDSGLAYVVIHGAGSFGHFSAKEYGLKGQFPTPTLTTHNQTSSSSLSSLSQLSMKERRYKKQGLTKTRLSVQKLNHHVVESLVAHGVNAVGMSPCFGIPGMEASSGSIHDHDDDDPTTTRATTSTTSPLSTLSAMVLKTVQSGLVPVLHGDACLYGDHDVGILSGDVLMEVLGSKNSWITEAIFITDVDGVYDHDPRQNPNAQLLRQILVDPTTGGIVTELAASGSSHEHDVTGGLQVRVVVVFDRQIPFSHASPVVHKLYEPSIQSYTVPSSFVHFFGFFINDYDNDVNCLFDDIPKPR
jgi:isopentenyl phosphate kinase